MVAPRDDPVKQDQSDRENREAREEDDEKHRIRVAGWIVPETRREVAKEREKVKGRRPKRRFGDGDKNHGIAEQQWQG